MTHLINSILCNCTIDQFRAKMQRLGNRLGANGWVSSKGVRLVFGEYPFVSMVYRPNGDNSEDFRFIGVLDWKNDSELKFLSRPNIKRPSTRASWVIHEWRASSLRPQYHPTEGLYEAAIEAYEEGQYITRVDFLDVYSVEDSQEDRLPIGRPFEEFIAFIIVELELESRPVFTKNIIIEGDYVKGDKISTGNISSSSNIAIGSQVKTGKSKTEEGNLTQPDRALVLPTIDSFDVQFVEDRGQNLFHVAQETKKRNIVEFFVTVHFKLWLEYAIEILNIDLQYSPNIGVTKDLEISIDNGFEKIGSSFRMLEHKPLQSNKTYDMIIMRRFTALRSDTDHADYGKISIVIEFAADAWRGIKKLNIYGKLEAGGKVSGVSKKIT